MPILPFRGPFVGQNEEDDPSFLSPRHARYAINCVLDSGRIKKRGGWIEVLSFSDTGDGAILGTYDYVKNDGTRLTLVKSGANLYAVTASGSTWSKTKLNSSFSFSAENLASFLTVNNRVYICDGTAVKVTDGISVYDLQIAKPASAPTLALSGAAGAGVLSGDYQYVYTYYSTLWGQESQSSAASASILPNGQSVEVTMTNSADDRMAVGGKIRIYRRKVDANEQFFYLVTTVDQGGGGSTVFVDTIRDNDVTLGTISPPTGAAIPSDTSIMAQQGGVLLFSGSQTSPQTVYYTRATVENPVTLMGAFDVGSTGDSERVTGLASYRSITVVFKESSIWAMAGDSRETFYAQKVIPNVGCRGHHTIVYSEGLLYFMAADGFRWFDGARTERISDPIKTTIDARTKEFDRLCCGALFSDLGMILWTYTTSGASSPNKLAAYFYRNSARTGEQSWSPWEFQEATPTYLAVTRDALTGVPLFVYGMNQGILGVYGTTPDGDNGQPIRFQWRTGKQSFGRNDVVKLWRRMSLQCVATAAGQLVSLKVVSDDAETGVLLHDQDMSDPNVERRIGTRASELSIELSNHNVAPVEVIWLALEGDILERRS